MFKADIINRMEACGAMAIVRTESIERGKEIARGCLQGGIDVMEISYTLPNAGEVITALNHAFGADMLVGAGTVLTTEQVDRAVAAGAKFIVSPGLNPRIVKYCVEKQIPITPGCANPSDVEQALENGLDVVKFFPAEQAGGLAYIKAIAAPYVGVKFMPTGGINAKNVKEYLACDKILACGGSWMVKGDLVKAGEFDKIRELVKEAVEIVKESRGK